MHKIIIVEDDDNVRSNLIELLEAEGYQTIAAKNGEEGYRLITGKLPDLIICDIRMPDLDGYGLLMRCAQEPQTAAIPFIFLTALNERENFRKGMELGADDFITKPFTRSEILHAIETRVDKRVMLEKISQQKLLQFETRLEWAIPYELLSPISSLLRYSEYLIHNNDTLNSADFLKIGSEIQWTLSKLVGLIQNYVMFSELGSILLDKEKLAAMRSARVTNMENLIVEIVTLRIDLEGKISQPSVRLESGNLKIDEFYLQKIIELVLDNIISRAQNGRAFEVEGVANPEKHKYLLRIFDQGRLMTPEQQRIVNGFVQLAARTDFRHEKPEIGLLVLQRILEVFDGTIHVSEIESGTTQIEIELPMPEK